MNCKEQSHEGREGILKKKKSIQAKKNKKLLKTRNKTPAFLAVTSSKEDSTCQTQFLTSVNHHAGKITGCWKGNDFH